MGLSLWYFRMHHSKQSCPRFDSISSMVLLSRPWTCSIESLTSLKRSPLYLGRYFLFRRKNEELVSGGTILIFNFCNWILLYKWICVLTCNIICHIFCVRELEKIRIQGDDLYLPTAPNKLVKGIQIDSGVPLQSAAKVPIIITFNVVDRDGNHNDVKPQACIFKVSLCIYTFC